MEYSCTTAQAKVYQLRKIKNGEESCSWANITVREWNGGGSIDIQSDYGDFSNSWSDTDEEYFTKFLCDLDYTYFMGKCHSKCGREFDAKASVQTIRETILEMRRDGSIAKEDARECWNDLKKSDLENIKNKTEYFSMMPPIIESDVYGGEIWDIPTAERDIPSCRFFWNTAWQAACQVWQKELAAM